MRATTVFRKLLAVTYLFVTEVSFGASGLVLDVRPSWRRARCSQCGKVAPGYDTSPRRFWRHLAQGRNLVWLAYASRRVQCPTCGVRVEQVPWAEADSRFTYDFEEMAAYLAQITDKTKVTEILGISWRTVGRIVERVIARRLDNSCLEDLRLIGVDEFSYRKRHHYLTVVVDHERERVVWAKEGSGYEALKGFFQELGLDRCLNIQVVSLDMGAGYLKAAQEWLPQATVVFDRFHVQRLASDAVDDVRREIVRELGETEDAKAVKNTRFVLLKRPENLYPSERLRLSELGRAPLQEGPWLPSGSTRTWPVVSWSLGFCVTEHAPTARCARRGRSTG